MGALFPTLKRGANDRCAYGANFPKCDTELSVSRNRWGAVEFWCALCLAVRQYAFPRRLC
jgi:hypothetical protein